MFNSLEQRVIINYLIFGIIHILLQLENGVLLPSLRPMLPLLDLHGVRRLDFHTSVLEVCAGVLKINTVLSLILCFVKVVMQLFG